MQSNTLARSEAGIVAIHVGRRLDFSLRDQFFLACRRAQLLGARKIVIDLAYTRTLHESGLALLMMLHDRAWYVRDGIELVNCNALLRARLERELHPGMFCLA